jgi:hypothetical protein
MQVKPAAAEPLLPCNKKSDYLISADFMSAFFLTNICSLRKSGCVTPLYGTAYGNNPKAGEFP